MIKSMKRTLAAAVAAGVIMGLAGPAPTTPAAWAKAPRPALMPRATLHVVPGWTYQGTGRLAVIASCSQRGDLRVVGSKLLPRPVTLRKGPDLLIKITNKTRPGKYTINLFCIGKHQQIDSAAMKKVRILKVLGAFLQPDQPKLPKHFKPDVTVSSGPPVKAKTGHGQKKGR
jgi:hypothetical protein